MSDPVKPRPGSPSQPITVGDALHEQIKHLLAHRGAAILVAKQLPPLEDNVALLNEEIEVLYEYITHRYTIPMDMLIILIGVAINIGHESFDQAKANEYATDPKTTMTRLLHDLIDQYNAGKHRRVH